MTDLLSLIAPIAAIVAAVIAGLFAYRANQATIAHQRIVELEKRLATSRLDAYKPLMEAIAKYFTKDKLPAQVERRRNEQLLEALQDAALWIPVYGSDDTVKVFQRMMQVAFSGAPPPIMMRVYGEFMLSIRRDLGDAGTAVTLVDLLGIRINDIYSGGLAADLRLSDAEYYRKHDWTPPWAAGE